MAEAYINPTDVSRILEIAQIAARLAGDYLLQKHGSARVLGQKSARDDLLDADIEAERLILATLQAETPDFGFLSEEAGRRGATGETDSYWIIDPLDGSANFQHGSPLFAVSIAFVAHQTTRAGVIYLPTSHEMFVAAEQQGAYLNDRPIHVSTIKTLAEAIVHVGDFMKADQVEVIPERLHELSMLAMQVRRVRMMGTAATDLAYVACGRADLLINHAHHPWDIEAGKLLLQEAGGKVTVQQCIHDRPLAIYSNSMIHSEVEQLFD